MKKEIELSEEQLAQLKFMMVNEGLSGNYAITLMGFESKDWIYIRTIPTVRFISTIKRLAIDYYQLKIREWSLDEYIQGRLDKTIPTQNTPRKHIRQKERRNKM